MTNAPITVTNLTVERVVAHLGLTGLFQRPNELEKLARKLENYLNEFTATEFVAKEKRLNFIRNILYNNHKDGCYCCEHLPYQPKGIQAMLFPYGKCLNCYRIESDLRNLFLGVTLMPSIPVPPFKVRLEEDEQ